MWIPSPTPMARPKQILLVDDNPDDVELTLCAFKRADLAVQVEVARDGVEARTAKAREEAQRVAQVGSWEWQAGDTIFIPPLSWHKHVNETDQPARYYAASSAPLFERLPTMPGVSIDPVFQRHYPVQGAALGHLLGYVRDVDVTNLRRLLRQATVVPIDDATSARALGLMDSFFLSHGLVIPDALIAATALEHGLTLYTRNVRDFQVIPSLTLVRPY